MYRLKSISALSHVSHFHFMTFSWVILKIIVVCMIDRWSMVTNYYITHIVYNIFIVYKSIKKNCS